MKLISIQFILRAIRRLSLAAIHLLIAWIISWLLLRLTVGDQLGPVRLGSYFAPWMFLALFPALLVALLARKRWLTGVIGLLLLLFGLHYSPLFWPRLAQARAAVNDGELRVMTFNVHYANRNATGIAEMIRAEQPDVIAMQELTEDLGDPLLSKLAADYPYHLIEDWGLRLTLISRYPLTPRPRPVGLSRAQQASVETPNGPITLWNIHPPTAIGNRSWQAQHQTLRAIAAEISGTSGPIIVLGDFNTTPDAENYGLIAAHLTDVHQVVGRGFGFTFPQVNPRFNLPWYTHPVHYINPVVRIDHIFVSPHFIPLESDVIEQTLDSDHRPVVATLQMTR